MKIPDPIAASLGMLWRERVLVKLERHKEISQAELVNESEAAKIPDSVAEKANTEG